MDQNQPPVSPSPIPQAPLPGPVSSTPQGSFKPRIKFRFIIAAVLVALVLSTSGLVYYFKSTTPLGSTGSGQPGSGESIPDTIKNALHLGGGSQNDSGQSSKGYTAAQVEGYFEGGDSASIIAFIQHQLTDAVWISQIGKPVVIILSTENKKYPLFEANRTTEITTHADLCKIVSSDDCQHLGDNSYYIFMSADLLKTQPYIKVALVASSLRSIYDEVNPHVASNQGLGSCSGRIVDEDYWEAKFWLSLSAQQKAPLEGFDNSLIAKENKRAANYMTNTIQDTNLISKHCPSDTVGNPASPSAKQPKNKGV